MKIHSEINKILPSISNSSKSISQPLGKKIITLRNTGAPEKDMISFEAKVK